MIGRRYRRRVRCRVRRRGRSRSRSHRRRLLLVLRRLALVRLEADLEHAVAQGVAVQALYGHYRLLVIGHRHEPEALTLVRLQVAYDLDRLDGAERPEQLPEHILLGLGCEVVYKDTPAGAVHRVTGQHRVREKVTRQRTVPGTRWPDRSLNGHRRPVAADNDGRGGDEWENERC